MAKCNQLTPLPVTGLNVAWPVCRPNRDISWRFRTNLTVKYSVHLPMKNTWQPYWRINPQRRMSIERNHCSPHRAVSLKYDWQRGGKFNSGNNTLDWEETRGNPDGRVTSPTRLLESAQLERYRPRKPLQFLTMIAHDRNVNITGLTGLTYYLLLWHVVYKYCSIRFYCVL